MPDRNPGVVPTPQRKAVVSDVKAVVLAVAIDNDHDRLLFGDLTNGNLKSIALRPVREQSVQILVGCIGWREMGGAGLKILKRRLAQRKLNQTDRAAEQISPDQGAAGHKTQRC